MSNDVNQHAINPSNAITILYGISGVGKSRQIDEAAEYMWETYKKITRIYVSDLGGWGIKRLSLIRLGIVQVWYFVNHVDPWSTAELASLGYWPQSFLNTETGMALPTVGLIAPRTTQYILRCPSGHALLPCRTEQEITLGQPCPVCGVQTTPANCLGVETQVIRSKGFSQIGLYCYDSLTQLNESGMEAAAEAGA